MNKKTLQDLPDSALQGKRVLVRVDYNVPMAEGKVSDDTRIRATLPTLEYLVARGARVILFSHLGRPKGQWNEKYTLKAAAERLGELVKAPVKFVGDIVGADAHQTVDALKPGEIVVLENVRFLPTEEMNDPKLSDEMASLADVYVNDAFGSAHRAHASTAGVAEAAKREGKPAVGGFLMQKELDYLGSALENPARPFVAILGGAKISGKLDVIENLLPKVDKLIIGGAMANTFFRALGLQTGKSLVEEDRVDMAKDVLKRAGDKLVLPVDAVVAPEATAESHGTIVDRDKAPAEAMILDIGPRSVATFREILNGARTIVWNGPMGMFEIEAFARGTIDLARAVAEATDRGATTIIGGGDSVKAIEDAGVAQRMSHVSTGGGASLEFLEGKTLPGVALLDEKGA